MYGETKFMDRYLISFSGRALLHVLIRKFIMHAVEVVLMSQKYYCGNPLVRYL